MHRDRYLRVTLALLALTAFAGHTAGQTAEEQRHACGEGAETRGFDEEVYEVEPGGQTKLSMVIDLQNVAFRNVNFSVAIRRLPDSFYVNGGPEPMVGPNELGRWPASSGPEAIDMNGTATYTFDVNVPPGVAGMYSLDVIQDVEVRACGTSEWIHQRNDDSRVGFIQVGAADGMENEARGTPWPFAASIGLALFVALYLRRR